MSANFIHDMTWHRSCFSPSFFLCEWSSSTKWCCYCFDSVLGLHSWQDVWMRSRLWTVKFTLQESPSLMRHSQIRRWVVVCLHFCLYLEISLTAWRLSSSSTRCELWRPTPASSVSLEPYICNLEHHHIPLELCHWLELHDLKWYCDSWKCEFGRDNGPGAKQHSKTCQLGLARLLGWRWSAWKQHLCKRIIQCMPGLILLWSEMLTKVDLNSSELPSE